MAHHDHHEAHDEADIGSMSILDRDRGKIPWDRVSRFYQGLAPAFQQAIQGLAGDLNQPDAMMFVYYLYCLINGTSDTVPAESRSANFGRVVGKIMDPNSIKEIKDPKQIAVLVYFGIRDEHGESGKSGEVLETTTASDFAKFAVVSSFEDPIDKPESTLKTRAGEHARDLIRPDFFSIMGKVPCLAALAAKKSVHGNEVQAALRGIGIKGLAQLVGYFHAIITTERAKVLISGGKGVMIKEAQMETAHEFVIALEAVLEKAFADVIAKTAEGMKAKREAAEVRAQSVGVGGLGGALAMKNDPADALRDTRNPLFSAITGNLATIRAQFAHPQHDIAGAFEHLQHITPTRDEHEEGHGHGPEPLMKAVGSAAKAVADLLGPRKGGGSSGGGGEKSEKDEHHK